MPPTTEQLTAVLDGLAALYREAGIKGLALAAIGYGIEIGDAKSLHTDPVGCLVARLASHLLGTMVTFGAFCARVYDLPTTATAADREEVEPIIRYHPIPDAVTDAIAEFDSGAVDHLFPGPKS